MACWISSSTTSNWILIVERTVAGETINLADGALLKVISPGEKQLEKLLDKWEMDNSKKVVWDKTNC